MAIARFWRENESRYNMQGRRCGVCQKVCPVSGEPLGSMGVPVKVTVKDRDVLLCCEGCRSAILDDPDKYLAKLEGK